MTREDVAVVPRGDAICAAQVARGGAGSVTFGLNAGDVSVDGDEILDRMHGQRYPTEAIRLRGAHNVANACAAIAVVGALGVSGGAVEQGLASFEGLEHRSVLVAEIGGVRYYDDSKATNVGAAVAALRGLRERCAVLIAGGRDKQGAYEPLVDALGERGRALVVLGEAADRIAQAVGDALPIERAATMAEAVRIASRLAKAGDAVLLSPACSSYDMYPSYKARGDDFAAEVERLAGEA
jgi:UDP-N-acetylmuramoylalanine--D-glutamate ligase